MQQRDAGVFDPHAGPVEEARHRRDDPLEDAGIRPSPGRNRCDLNTTENRRMGDPKRTEAPLLAFEAVVKRHTRTLELLNALEKNLSFAF